MYSFFLSIRFIFVFMAKKTRVGINAFKREIGKNTGKAVSNFVFGDSHSTPYRVKIQREKTKHIEKEAELNAQKELGNLEKDIQVKIHELSHQEFPETEKRLISYLLEIEILINSSKWKGIGINGDEKHKITNEYSDALYSKYKQGVELLKLSGGNSTIVAKFESKIKGFSKKKFFGKYWFWLLFFGLLVFIFLLVTVLN